MTTYYKVLGAGHTAIHGGDFTYTPDEWTPFIEDVKECDRGNPDAPLRDTREEAIQDACDRRQKGADHA